MSPNQNLFCLTFCKHKLSSACFSDFNKNRIVRWPANGPKNGEAGVWLTWLVKVLETLVWDWLGRILESCLLLLTRCEKKDETLKNVKRQILKFVWPSTIFFDLGKKLMLHNQYCEIDNFLLFCTVVEFYTFFKFWKHLKCTHKPVFAK